MIIQHNMPSMFANRNLKITTGDHAKTSERLASGYRINRAADDAAGLSISEKLRSLVRGHNRAAANVMDGISLLQVADGALNEVHDMLHRMSELAIQAANDTNTDDDRENLQDEIDAIKNEINRISTDTEFNTIKIFKPTNVPEMTGIPIDILAYHDVGNRVGGVIYNGKRYQYGKDIPVQFVNGNENGNIEAGQYTFLAEGENGEVPITLIFDGSSRTPSSRKYQMDVKDDGIYVDNVCHSWSVIRNTVSNKAFNPDNIEGGKYSFRLFGTGPTISFSVEDGIDLESFRDEIVPDGLEAYVIKSSSSSLTEPQITSPHGLTISNIDTAKQDYIPKYIPSNSINPPHNVSGSGYISDLTSSGYRMHADNTGIYMYLPAAYNPAGKNDVKFDLKTWDDLGLSEWLSGASVNPGNTVHGENFRTYTYEIKKDDIGLNLGTITFSIDSETSKDEVIASINDWRFYVQPNNYMNFDISTPDSGATVSHYTHSSTLDSYGTHYDMGRDMDHTLALTFPDGQGMKVNGNSLSFTMADANNKKYTFSANNVKNTIEYSVTDAFTDYVSAYASAYRTKYQNYLNTTAGKNNPNGFTLSSADRAELKAITSAAPFTRVTFNDTTNNHSVTLNIEGTKRFGVDWQLSPSDFTTSYTKNNYTGRLTAYVTQKNNLTGAYQSKLDEFTNKIFTALTKTTINSVTATNNSPGQTSATVTPYAPLKTENQSYGSIVTSDDRKVKIQAGPRKNQAIEIKLPAMNTGILKIGSVNVSTYSGASTAIGQIAGAVEYISDMRSGYGATQNRLEYAYAINNSSEENTQAAESRIRDADMADEMVIYSKDNILMQATESILAQNNQATERVLSLLQ